MFRSYTEKIQRPKLRENATRSQQFYTCDLCDESYWLTETDVELHKKEFHFSVIREQMENHMERFCTICMKLQENHNALLEHIKTRHLLSTPTARRVEREIFICDHCNHIFFNKDLLQAHIMFSHLWPNKEKKMKKIPCPKCKKICRVKSIWFHLQLHEIPSISICDICVTNFWNLKELEKHLKTHAMFYKCEICNYQTTKETLYEAHLDGHQKTRFRHRQLKQRQIQYAFRKLEPSGLRYNIHHSLRGLELPRFIHICILCREICTDKIEVKNHILRDHLQVEETKKTQFVCHCGEEFFNRVLLKHHIFKTKGDHRELTENERAAAFSPEQEPEVIEPSSEPSNSPPSAANEDDQLTFIYAEVHEDQQSVGIEAENSGEVLGF